MVTRQEIIDKAVEIMSTISEFENVRDSETNWDKNELPALSVFDSVTHKLANGEPEAFSQVNIIRLSFQVSVKGSAEDVRSLMKKVSNKVGDNRTFEGLAMWTHPVSSRMEYKQDAVSGSFDLVGGNVEVDVYVSSDSFDF